jgi:hypothetical protein
MIPNFEKARSIVFTLSVCAALLVTLLASSCQGPSISSGSGDKADLNLSFSVLGASASKPGAAPSKSISRLILPTATELTVSLTPLDSGLGTPSPQVVPIPSSSGTQVISASFTGVELGKYTLKAVASDSSGKPQFQQSSTLTVSGTETSATIDLLPMSIYQEVATGEGEGSFYIDGLAIPARTAFSFRVLASVISAYGWEGIPIGDYAIQLSVSSGSGELQFFSQDYDGSSMDQGRFDTEGTIYAASGSYVGYPGLYVTPSSHTAPTFLTVYNSSDAEMSFNMVVNSGTS